MQIGQSILVAVLAGAAAWSVVWLWRRDVLRPGALRRLAGAGGVRDADRVHPGAWTAACAATFLAAPVGAGIGWQVLGGVPRSGAEAEPGRAALAELMAYVLAGAAGLLCAGVISRKAREAGAERVGLVGRWADVGKGLGALIVVLPLCIAAGLVAGWIATWICERPPMVSHEGLREMVENRDAWHAWVRVGLAVVGAPVVEELVYRVFLQSAVVSALARARGQGRAGPGDVFWGIVVSTGAFVLPHAAALSGPASWNALPTLAVLGVGLGLAYERTRSPVVPVVMHAGFNALNVAMAMLTAGADRLGA